MSQGIQPQGPPPNMKNFVFQQPRITLLSQSDCQDAAKKLNKAMKGMGTKESDLISILGGYHPLHMNQIIIEYQKKYGKTLEEDVKKETSGNFGDLCCALCKPIIEYDVECIRKGMKKNVIDCVIEFLVGRTNSDVRALALEYNKRYGEDALINKITSETSGTTEKILVTLLKGERDESSVIGNVEGDVETLYNAGEKKLGTDESVFINLLCKRPDNHLREVFDRYKEKYGHPFEKAIKNEFSGNSEKILKALVSNISNKAEFIADRFEESMKGLGTEDDELIRLTVRHRAPYIIEPIKQAYQAKYHKSLADRIKGDTSGDYRKLLLECIHENK